MPTQLTIVQAAYAGAYTWVQSGVVRAKVTLTMSDASTKEEWFEAHGHSLEECRNSITDQIAARNRSVTEGAAFAALVASAPVNADIPITRTVPATAPPAAADVWRGKFQHLVRLRASGVTTGALGAAIAALEADINATYQSGYADLV